MKAKLMVTLSSPRTINEAYESAFVRDLKLQRMVKFMRCVKAPMAQTLASQGSQLCCNNVFMASCFATVEQVMAVWYLVLICRCVKRSYNELRDEPSTTNVLNCVCLFVMQIVWLTTLLYVLSI